MSAVIRHSKLEHFYKDYLASECSADFVQSVATHYTIPTLEKLARSGDRIVRRAAVLGIGFLGDYSSNDALGRALLDSDRAVRLLADHGIRQLWFRISQPLVAASLNRMARENLRGNHADVVRLASCVIRIEPMVAEAWNQRAIALFAQTDYSHAACDCREALRLNPFHFVAAMGLANCHLHLDDRIAALDAFELALSINPDLDRVRAQIAQMK